MGLLNIAIDVSTVSKGQEGDFIKLTRLVMSCREWAKSDLKLSAEWDRQRMGRRRE